MYGEIFERLGPPPVNLPKQLNRRCVQENPLVWKEALVSESLVVYPYGRSRIMVQR